jgi:hypothetical protein
MGTRKGMEGSKTKRRVWRARRLNGLVKGIDTVGRKEAGWSERNMRELGEDRRSSVQMSSDRLGEGKSVSI